MAEHPAKSYGHPEADAVMRPDIGTQAQFKKKKEPKTYSYDSSLSPTLEYDGQNYAREHGEALLKQILDTPGIDLPEHLRQQITGSKGTFLSGQWAKRWTLRTRASAQ
jgi:hypothetical protein